MRTTNKAGVDLIKAFEGLELQAYRDSVGVLTIGYGHTKGVKEGMRITEAEAEDLLREDLAWAEKAVWSAVEVPLTDDQFAALVSFTFNLGETNLRKSTLLRKLNAGDYASVPSEMARWNKAGGKELAGLTRRRKAEGDLFSSGGAVSPEYVEHGVKLIQEGLHVLGFDPGAVDGIMGAKTTAAMEAAAANPPRA